jgi:hypothetical protein
VTTLRVVKGSDDQHYPKASLFLRAGARLVDCAVAWLLYKSTGPAGVVMALMYILFADAMIQGQSLGKKLFGVKAIFLPTRQGARHRDSVLRNAPFGLVIILYMMPDLGHIAFIGGAIVIGGIEAVRVIRDPQGLRLGDLWAQTQVIDGKVPAGQGEVIRPAGEEARAASRANRTQDQET